MGLDTGLEILQKTRHATCRSRMNVNVLLDGRDASSTMKVIFPSL